MIPEHHRWFKDTRYGMFIHWGPYAFFGRGEQVLFREHMNPVQYVEQACRWDPQFYDAREWAHIAKQAGFRYAVLTTRHHDGYCLWDSGYTDYSSAQQAPKRDLVGEFADAFRDAGLRVGFYYSFVDWRLPAYFEGPDYVEIYLKDLPRAGAIAVVIFAGMMAGGRFLVAKLSKKISLKMLMMCSALLGFCISGIIPFATDLIWFYALLAVAGIAAACFWPTILAEAANCMEVDSTILFVMLACVGVAGFGFIPWIMGIIGNSVGLRSGFSIIPGLFVGLIIVLSIEWRISHTQRIL